MQGRLIEEIGRRWWEGQVGFYRRTPLSPTAENGHGGSIEAPLKRKSVNVDIKDRKRLRPDKRTC